MSTPRIVCALGHVDDDLVSGATRPKVQKKHAWLKWGSAAACLVMMAVAVAWIAPLLLGRDAPVPTVSGETQLEKYYDYGISEGMFSSYIRSTVIAEERIGSKLRDVSVTAGWKNEAGQWLTVETLSAEVYSIEGIGTDLAVALRFTEKGEALTTTHYYAIVHPNAEYNGMLFPDYKAENPVRYLEQTDMGKSNGWQDFGLCGEIRTVTVPVGSTYIYQMYAYYIRNDLRHIYLEGELPDALADLPEWLSDTTAAGRRSFWYSMGNRIPQTVTVEATATLTSEGGAMQCIQAEYRVHFRDGTTKKEERWIIYFMEEDGVYSAFAVVANENYDFVKTYSETIVRSYQKKQ